MYKTHGSINIRTVNGRKGPFRVGFLTIDLGEFVVKQPLLNKFEEGTHEGIVTLARIEPSVYTANGRVITEIRATLFDLQLGVEAPTEKSKGAGSEVKPAPAKAPVPTEKAAPAKPPAQDGNPAPAGKSVPAEKSAPAESPVPVEKPAPAGKPVPVEKPAPAEKPVPAGKPAPAEKPVPVEKSASAGKPVPARTPAPAKKAAPAKKSAPAPTDGADSDAADAELFGHLWPQIRDAKPGDRVKLDKTVPRPRLHQQSERLGDKGLNWEFDYPAQAWVKPIQH